MSIQQPLVVKLRLTLRSPVLRSTVIYLVIAPTSSVVSILIGSMSEYRFPHILTTTTIHLLISLISLLLVQSTISILRLQQNRGKIRRRQLSTTEPESIDEPFKTSSIISYLTPTNLASTLLSTLASILQSHSFHNIPNSTPINTLSIPILLLLSCFKSLSKSIGVTSFSLPTSLSGVIGIVLFLGEGVRRWSSEGAEEAVTRISLSTGYAVGIVGWVLALKLGFKEGYTSTTSPPTIIYHLISTLILFIPAMLLSGELINIYLSGHFGFFTEIGFWAQEIGMAWCGLANLWSFWNLVQNLDPMMVFAVVGLKDHYLPYFYSFIFGNNLGKSSGSTILSPGQQHWIFCLLGVYGIANWVVQSRSGEEFRRISLDSRTKIG